MCPVKMFEFSAQKKELLSKYDSLINLNGDTSYFSHKEIDELVDRKNTLVNERYTIAVCGQIKSGKSTLLNAILFGDQVLPSDHTPHTAKITVIKYGEIGYEASFYTEQEIAEIKNNDKGIAKQLAEDLDSCAKRNILITDLLGTTHKGEDLNNLHEYVSANGKYTPIVKEVAIFYPSEMLRDADVVDTPGTNDSNPVRDAVTRDWIYKADAVIYCTYIGRVFDESDCNFIDKFLFRVQPSHRIFAATKVDTISDDDHASLMSYLEGIVVSEANENRKLIDSVHSIYPVCQLASLIKSMETNSSTMSNELEFEAENLERKGYLTDTDDGVFALVSAIEKKLLDNKGKRIINCHDSYLSSFLSKKLRDYEFIKNDLNSTIKNIGCEIVDIDKRCRTLNSAIKSIEESTRELKVDLDVALNKEQIALEKNLGLIWDNFLGVMRPKIKNSKNEKFLRKNLWVMASSASKKVFPDLQTCAGKFSSQISRNLKEKLLLYKESIKIDLTYVFYKIESMIQNSFYSYSESISSTLENNFSPDHIKAIHDQYVSTTLGMVLWVSSDELECIKDDLIEKMDKWASDCVHSMASNSRDVCSSEFEKLLSELEGDVKRVIAREQNILNDIRAGKKTKDQVLIEANEQLNSIVNIESYLLKIKEDLSL